MELIICEIAIFSCLCAFAGIGIWALARNEPMHLWSGTKVPPENITDIKRFNRANAKIWFCYSIPMAASMVIAPFSIIPAILITSVGSLVGIIPVIIAYRRLLNKYLVPGSEPYEEL